MINVAGIVSGSIVDGPGLRTVIFCQGCPHHCEGCHNPETWDFTTKTMMSTGELVDIIRSDPLCHGVTFSGGEPFAQANGFAELGEELKSLGYEVASFTGYTFEKLIGLETEQIAEAKHEPAYITAIGNAQRVSWLWLLNTIDVLIDGRFVLSQRNLDLMFRGSENQRILDVKESLKLAVPVWSKDPRWVGDNTSIM